PTSAGPTTAGPTSAPTTSASASESGTQTDSDAGTTAPTTTVTTTEAITGTATTPPKFDLGVQPDAGDGCGGGGGGNVEFSYIWVANSAQGTISKINTVTMVEEGRYVVRPDSAGNPSRTSVNLAGDVAVANRYGGVTKVLARTEDCVESNGMPG